MQEVINSKTNADLVGIKEDWIKSKYVWKGFLEYKNEDGKICNTKPIL